MENSPGTADMTALDISIEELRRDLEFQIQRVESVRSTARTILASGSLVLALISAFQIVAPQTEAISPETYRSLYILVLALYVIMISSCIMALWPGQMSFPAGPDGRDLHRRLEGAGEVEARRILLEAYTGARDRNRGPARRLKITTTLGAVLLPVIVVVLLFLSFNVPVT